MTVTSLEEKNKKKGKKGGAGEGGREGAGGLLRKYAHDLNHLIKLSDLF